MGLDQYAFHRRKGDLPDVRNEIAYWRKHNRLEGWMSDLYYEKNPDDKDTFNCKEVLLTREDLSKLENDIVNRHLPETSGFFFGGDSYEDYEGEHGYMQHDLEFIENARNSLERFGGEIIYTSWW